MKAVSTKRGRGLETYCFSLWFFNYSLRFTTPRWEWIIIILCLSRCCYQELWKAAKTGGQILPSCQNLLSFYFSPYISSITLIPQPEACTSFLITFSGRTSDENNTNKRHLRRRKHRKNLSFNKQTFEWKKYWKLYSIQFRTKRLSASDKMFKWKIYKDPSVKIANSRQLRL